MFTVPSVGVQTTALEPHQTMTVTTDANSSGVIRRIASDGSAWSPPESIAILAGTTLKLGTFPTVRNYRIEASAGSLTYSLGIGDMDYSTLLGNVEGFTGSRTLTAADNGKLLRCDDSSAVTVTVPNTLPQGFNIGVAQWGAGAVTVSAGASATKRSTASGPSAQYKIGAILVAKNVDGLSAEFTLNGEVA
jgi:hypothetical protein